MKVRERIEALQSAGEAKDRPAPWLNVVLLEPEIPQNTGNISRTCAVTGAALHLIEPMGFSIDDRWLKRAGLDYWDQLAVFTYSGWEDFCRKNPEARPWMASSKGARSLYAAPLETEGPLWLLFGKETKGLPEALLAANREKTVRLPMLPGARCLNLSNAVAVTVYEALRRRDFSGLEGEGALTEQKG